MMYLKTNISKPGVAAIIMMLIIGFVFSGCVLDNSEDIPSDDTLIAPSDETDAGTSGDDNTIPPSGPAPLSFTLVPAATHGISGFTEAPSCSVADIDGDEDIDVLITGEPEGENAAASYIFTNDGSVSFLKGTGEVLSGISYSESAFTDIDNDGDMDICISGRNNFGSTRNHFSAIYLNNGNGNYSDARGNISLFRNSSFIFGDLNGDGFKDLIITGNVQVTPYSSTNIYLNMGNDVDGDWLGVTSSDHAAKLPQVENGSVDLADADADGDLDLLITGELPDYAGSVTALYLNAGDPESDGWDGFTNSYETFTAMNSSDAAFTDINGDSFPDIIIAGATGSSSPGVEIYFNNGSAEFSRKTTTALTPVSIANIVTGDPDADGDIDLVINGFVGGTSFITRFYRNDGNGNFTEEDMGFLALRNAEGQFFDADGDGDLDFINCGDDPANSNVGTTELWLNNINN